MFGDLNAIHILILVVVAVGLYKASKVVMRRRHSPPERPSVAASAADELSKLARLKHDGILSDAEFEAQKKKVLGG
jgi:hypothetical protein